MAEDFQLVAKSRESECAERAEFFEDRLRFFSKTNWITLIVPSLLGVLAGAALSSNVNPIWLGLGALIAALLTAIHKGLDCDAHQEECRRIVQANRSFEVRYRTLHQIGSENIIEELRALDNELAALRASQLATVEPLWFKKGIKK
ncbi:hypothetical protein [Cognaticolwellia beringensis]|uniref:SMODS and SLOG-associating 2TM effector domain-containing protein n=1 Tax=Cognaticolwellia beringensis TaxID=1967665 RepID=A0A222GC28_9GAMM|nr:hypothetical protein [Cognaticolwellia beringensis]ASP49426.1 hypothetical protein B5D82_17605 [Cognaticolwellia beringensis]